MMLKSALGSLSFIDQALVSHTEYLEMTLNAISELQDMYVSMTLIRGCFNVGKVSYICSQFQERLL